jgi:hypothetical protein
MSIERKSEDVNYGFERLVTRPINLESLRVVRNESWFRPSITSK